MAWKKILIAGGSGLVGSKAALHFGAQDGCDVLVASRRPPPVAGVRHLRLDLTDRVACAKALTGHGDITHIVYAAVYEQAGLVAGWSDAKQIDVNDAMFRNLLDPLAGSVALRHVTLFQGTKAYGVHIRPFANPAREGRSEYREQPNFYWRQEDHLRETQVGKPWSWTILRPVHVFGDTIGVSLNAILGVGLYAAIMKHRGEPLHYPGGPPRLSEAVDADLLARCVAWAGEAETARNQVFNVANGDVFTWENVWPSLARVFGMELGEHRPLSLGQEMSRESAAWDEVRARHDLLSPSLEAFAGKSLQFADYTLRYGMGPQPPQLVSTVKLRQAGFHEVMDTEAMFAKWFGRLQADRLLPPALADAG